MKRHATDDVDPVTHTLCGRPLPHVAGLVYTLTRVGGLGTIHVDNANPDCKRCLLVIAARLRSEA